MKASTGIHDQQSLIEWLCNKSLGRIVICNIVSALKEQLLDKDTVKGLLENYVTAYIENPFATVEEIIGLLEDVACGVKPVDLSKRRSFQLQCPKKTSTMNGKGSLSVVMDVGTLTQYYIDDAELADGHETFISNPDLGDPVLEEAIDALNIKENDIYRVNAYLGGNLKRPLFWITNSDLISKERQKIPAGQLADAVRDRLGLIHFEKDVPLVEIRIPCDRIKKRRSSRPTFADAGGHRRFRTLPDSRAAKRRTGWGCTVHLERLKAGDAIIDGAPERVVEPTAFNVHLGVELAYLGITKTARTTDERADRKFAERLCNQRNCKDIISDLLDEIQ